MTRFGWVFDVTFGLLFMGAGGFLLWLEMRVPPTHDGHVYLFSGMTLLGALMVRPKPILDRVQRIVIVIAPILPWTQAAKARRTSTSVQLPDENDRQL